MTGAALTFLIIYLGIIAIPCITIGFMGQHLLHRLGFYPSKTPAIQMSIFIKLLVVEIVSVVLLLTFFRALAE